MLRKKIICLLLFTIPCMRILASECPNEEERNNNSDTLKIVLICYWPAICIYLNFIRRIVTDTNKMKTSTTTTKKLYHKLVSFLLIYLFFYCYYFYHIYWSHSFRCLRYRPEDTLNEESRWFKCKYRKLHNVVFMVIYTLNGHSFGSWTLDAAIGK